jgi:uroporphyrinogen decarboxylase
LIPIVFVNQVIIDFIHEKGGKVKLHICGNITHLIPRIKKLKVDILDIDWQVDMEYAYTEMVPDVIRCGNINPVTIQDLTAEMLTEKTRNLILFEKGKKFILSGGCEITVKTSTENLIVMSEAW